MKVDAAIWSAERALEARGYRIMPIDPVDPSLWAYTRYDRRHVYVRPDLSERETLLALLHEMGHVELHAGTDRSKIATYLRDVEAELTAMRMLRLLRQTSNGISMDYLKNETAGHGDVLSIVLTLDADRLERAAARLVGGMWACYLPRMLWEQLTRSRKYATLSLVDSGQEEEA